MILYVNAQVCIAFDDVGEVLGQQRVDSGGYLAHAIVQRCSALVRVEAQVKDGDDLAEQGVECGRLVLHLGHLAGWVAIRMTALLVDLY